LRGDGRRSRRWCVGERIVAAGIQHHQFQFLRAVDRRTRISRFLRPEKITQSRQCRLGVNP
jgi:hypothetical protein